MTAAATQAALPGTAVPGGLRLERLRRTFGGLVAIDDVSLRVAPGERRAIIGPNGAGKTTLFNLIGGALPPSAGRIFLDDREVTGLSPFRRANLGLGRTFQRNNLFLNLTCFENVRLAVQHRQGIAARCWTPAARFGAVNAETARVLERTGLADRRDEPVKALAYGQQRALEIAVALACRPTILLLDEPTAGMSPAETAEMVRLIGDLPRGLTILIIEHDMDVVFGLADAITVLHEGRVLAEGTPAAIRDDRQVQEVYLGHDAEAGPA